MQLGIIVIVVLCVMIFSQVWLLASKAEKRYEEIKNMLSSLSKGVKI